MMPKTRYRVGTGANKEYPLCRRGNDRTLLWSDHQAVLIISEHKLGPVNAPHGESDPPYELGAAAMTLTRRVNAHRCEYGS